MLLYNLSNFVNLRTHSHFEFYWSGLFGNTAMNMSIKGCTEPEMCGIISINYGITRTVISVQCCTTDLCNTQDELGIVFNIQRIQYAFIWSVADENIRCVSSTDHTSNGPNGKQCYYCDENQNCLNKLNCLENEDYCITTKGKDLETEKKQIDDCFHIYNSKCTICSKHIL